MLKGLAGRSVLVTGGTGGIGAAMCRRMSAEGARVVVADLDGDAAQQLASSLPGGAVGVAADVTTAEGARRGVQAAIDAFGRLDLAHVNAGVESEVRAVAQFDPVDFQKVFAVNVLGAFLTAQAAVTAMTADGRGGGILFTASVAALEGTAGVSVYSSSKHAVLGLARCLAKEVAGQGIRVNTLCPGPVDTRMMRALEVGLGDMAGLDAAGFKHQLEQAVPLGRYATPEEIAATAAWLLSDEVPYAHGEVYTVAGGLAPG